MNIMVACRYGIHVPLLVFNFIFYSLADYSLVRYQVEDLKRYPMSTQIHVISPIYL